jgi:histidinol-phosphatase (PHP family)
VEDHFDGDALEAVRVYYTAVRGLVRRGGFDILGHIDLVKKNGAFIGKKRNDDDRFFSLDDPRYITYRKETAEAVREAQKQHGFAVEVNCGAIARGTFPDTYPDIPFLKELAPLPFIITGDAHRPEHLGAGYGQAERNLASAGITGKTIFPLGPLAVNIPAYR